jgi:hypothetical protein
VDYREIRRQSARFIIQWFQTEAKAVLKIRAEVSVDRIELVKEIPAASKTMRSARGRLVLAPTSVKMDSASALRVERDELSSRGLRK